MLKVAVFNTQPPHLYHGGVERRILEVGKRLNGRVFITVYSGTKSGFKRAVRTHGIIIAPCFSTDMFFPIDNWFFNKTITGKLNKIEADVYETHTASGHGIAKAFQKKMGAKPLILTIHGVLADEFQKAFKGTPGTLRMKLSKLFMLHLIKQEEETAKKATLIVTVSIYSLLKIVQLYHIDKDKIRVIPNGVDVERFKPLNLSGEEMNDVKKRMGLRDDEKCILYVGNLIPRKGLHLLIDAVKHVSKEMKEVKVVIVGRGPLKNSLIKYAGDKGVIKHFNFLGSVEDEILPKIYNCSDIVVLPSLQEGQGISLLEAQASGKPVIACKVGGIPEIVQHERTGILIEPNHLELARAIEKLLSDEHLREKMGENGRKFVCEKFTWEKCAQKMFDTYMEALNMH